MLCCLRHPPALLTGGSNESIASLGGVRPLRQKTPDLEFPLVGEWQAPLETHREQQQYPTKAAAWKAVESIPKQPRKIQPWLTVRTLVEQYRQEKMPKRASTRRGYETYLRKHILPKWQDANIREVQPRVVELWLRSLELAPKSKVHVRGLLHLLWDYAMWRGDVPTRRNPMALVEVQNASKRLSKPRTMTIEEFHRLSSILTEPYRTMATAHLENAELCRDRISALLDRSEVPHSSRARRSDCYAVT